MKKFLIFIACMMMLISASLYQNDLLGRFKGGLLTIYRNGYEIQFEAPLLDKYEGVKRLDLEGRFEDKQLLSAYDAAELWREHYDEMTLIYAFSPMMREETTIHGERVNLMIALRNDHVAIGTPILKGSY